MDTSKDAVTAQQESAPRSLEHEADAVLAKRVLRKIDWRLLPLMFITYNLNFMDKTILSSAAVFGLRDDNASLLCLNSRPELTPDSTWSVNNTPGCLPSSISATSSGNIQRLYSFLVCP